MIDIMLVDDDDKTREGLVFMIEQAKELRCAGEYEDCESALQAVEQDLPDVVLLDIAFPEGKMSGLDAIAKFKEKLPDVEILMLTVSGDMEAVFEALRRGATGYLVKDIDSDELLRAVTEICEGGAPMSMSIARQVAESFRRDSPCDVLTDREQEVLTKLCDGLNYQAIADELFIAKTTVKFHIKNIYRKLHVSGKVEAVNKVLKGCPHNRS
ncbi:DNA-binding response regulator [Candidatus Parcubacteria bacterium]|nr:MAG: DNA-binding response regulator [Candidatus Parcubacteria bacterium]